MSVRPANFLLPEDMFPDFSAVAVTEDGATTTLFSLSSVRTEYVVLVYLPTVTMVAELLALRDNLHKFTQVRQQYFGFGSGSGSRNNHSGIESRHLGTKMWQVFVVFLLSNGQTMILPWKSIIAC
jgi:peroxiredoxin